MHNYFYISETIGFLGDVHNSPLTVISKARVQKIAGDTINMPYAHKIFLMGGKVRKTVMFFLDDY